MRRRKAIICFFHHIKIWEFCCLSTSGIWPLSRYFQHPFLCKSQCTVDHVGITCPTESTFSVEKHESIIQLEWLTSYLLFWYRRHIFHGTHFLSFCSFWFFYGVMFYQLNSFTIQPLWIHHDLNFTLFHTLVNFEFYQK